MRCFYCGEPIAKKPRYVEVMGEKVPFCPVSYAILSKDCVNEYQSAQRPNVTYRQVIVVA